MPTRFFFRAAFRAACFGFIVPAAAATAADAARLFGKARKICERNRPEAGNHHLDTLEGRYGLQFEWRALARAFQAATPKEDHRVAVANTLVFSHERYRLSPTCRRRKVLWKPSRARRNTPASRWA